MIKVLSYLIKFGSMSDLHVLGKYVAAGVKTDSNALTVCFIMLCFLWMLNN